MYQCRFIYIVCPEGIQTCNMKNRDIYWRRYKTQETLYRGQWYLSPLQSRHLGTSHSSPSRHQLLHGYFPESHRRSESSSLSKVISVLGKARSQRAPDLVSRGAQSPGWFDVSPKNCMRHDVWADEFWWSCPSPVVRGAAFWITWIVSVEECSGLTQNLMQIHCCTHSVILNVAATQYTRSLNGVYGPHWLVQWNCPCSRCIFQPTLLGCQGTLMSHKLFLLY